MAGKKILVAPLDWGLGHATRCIPVIRELLKAGHDVVIAADGRMEHLLREEFFANALEVPQVLAFGHVGF